MGGMIRKNRVNWNFTGVTRFNGVAFNADAVGAVSDLSEEEIAAIVAAGVDIAALQAAVGTYEGQNDLATDVAALETAVGSYSGGALSDVATDVDALQTTVGDAQAGLVADVDALETAVGTYAGGADIATDLSGVVSTVGDAQAGLVADVDALETVVGTYNGESDISVDLGMLVNLVARRTAMLIPNTTNTFFLLDDSSTYTYNDTPSAPVTQSLNTYTQAVLTPGGSTAHTLAFSLPTAKTVPVFKVTYDKGTHAGTLMVTGNGGVAEYTLTGSGTMYFGWDESTEKYVSLATENCTIAVDEDATMADLFEVEFAPGAGVTTTITLPTTETTDVFGVIYKVDSTALGDVDIGDVESLAGNASSAMEVLTFTWSTDHWAFTDSIDIPFNVRSVIVTLQADGSTEMDTLTINLPNMLMEVSAICGISATITNDQGTALALDVQQGAYSGLAEDVAGVNLWWLACTEPVYAWIPFSAGYSPLGHTH